MKKHMKVKDFPAKIVTTKQHRKTLFRNTLNLFIKVSHFLVQTVIKKQHFKLLLEHTFYLIIEV